MLPERSNGSGTLLVDATAAPGAPPAPRFLGHAASAGAAADPAAFCVPEAEAAAVAPALQPLHPLHTVRAHPPSHQQQHLQQQHLQQQPFSPGGLFSPAFSPGWPSASPRWGGFTPLASGRLQPLSSRELLRDLECTEEDVFLPESGPPVPPSPNCGLLAPHASPWAFQGSPSPSRAAVPGTVPRTPPTAAAAMYWASPPAPGPAAAPQFSPQVPPAAPYFPAPAPPAAAPQLQLQQPARPAPRPPRPPGRATSEQHRVDFLEALASLAAAVAGPGGASASPSASISAASSAAEEAEERAAQGAGGVPRIASLPNLHLTNRRLASASASPEPSSPTRKGRAKSKSSGGKGGGRAKSSGGTAKAKALPRARSQTSITSSIEAELPPPSSDANAVPPHMAYLTPQHQRRGKGGRQAAPDPRLDPSIDPKKARRIMANRLSAAKSKLKQKGKLQDPSKAQAMQTDSQS